MNTEPQSTTRLPLPNFLRSAPYRFAHNLDDVAKIAILKECYYSLCGDNEEYIQLLFPNGLDDEALLVKTSAVVNNQGFILSDADNMPEFSEAQRGRPCGHVFRKGEGVYRCRNCALDDTCVFCSRCFHATNHDGHSTSFSISTGSGGCCDCGDQEAWKMNIKCLYHSPISRMGSPDEHLGQKQSVTLPLDLLVSIRAAIAHVLDFMLETWSVSPLVNASERTNEQKVKREAKETGHYLASVSKYSTPEDESEQTMFACVLWNDENHSFTQVIDQVMDATGCNRATAKHIAEVVDAHGRDIVELSADLPHLLRITQQISAIGLAVTVRSARDTFREQTCGLLVEWLRHITGGKLWKSIKDGANIIRDIFCEELCHEWRREWGTSEDDFDDGMIQDVPSYDDDDEMMEVGDEEYTSAEDDIEMSPAELGTSYRSTTSSSSSLTIRQRITPENKTDMMTKYQDSPKMLRLDWFLVLELRTWKEARVGLRELYIGTMVVNPDFKKIIGIRFARNYTKLADAFLLKDREPEHSIILFSVQLFTVPTVAAILVNQCNFIGILCRILHSFFTSDTVLSTPQPATSRINCDSDAFKNRRYFQVFHDLRYIIHTDIVRQSIARHPKYISQYIDLVSLFQGMNPQRRQTDTHVEYESETWVNAFNVTLQLAKSCRQFAECFQGNSKTVGMAIRRVLKKIIEWADKREEDLGILTGEEILPREQTFHVVETPTAGTFNIIAYDVASQHVSFHHPLHWFLAVLLENVRWLDDDLLFDAGYNSFKELMMGHDFDSPVLAVGNRSVSIQTLLEYPLRACVLLAQIRGSVWVRNGYGIRNQAHHYRDISLRDNTFDADIFLLQMGFVLLDPESFLVTILDRFCLLTWFSGKPATENYDMSQVIFMAEELLNLLIVCAAERAKPSGLDIDGEIRREIIHGLCLGTIAYSVLTKRISERLNEHNRFDDNLNVLANFKKPDGMNDHGLYELRDEYFDEVDPYFIHYTRNNREEAEEALKARMRKKLNLDPKASMPPLLPKLTKIEYGPFTKLGNMLHTKVMNQIIFFALWNIISNDKAKGDTLVDEALHLAMLAILDENNDNVLSSRQSSKRKGKQREGEVEINTGFMATFGTEEGTPGFIHHATFDGFPVMVMETDRKFMTLLALLISMMENNNFEEKCTKIEWIISKIDELGSTTAKAQIQEYRRRKYGMTGGSGENQGEGIMSESDRKKQAAKDRQQQIMAQFAKAQQNFLEQHEGLYDDLEDDEDMGDYDDGFNGDGVDASIAEETEILWQYPIGTCIVCQEETNQNELYGMLGFIQPSNMLRQTPLEDGAYISEILEVPDSLDIDIEEIRPFGVAATINRKQNNGPSVRETGAPGVKGFPQHNHSCPGLYTSSCGHLMHAKCFETYFSSLELRHQVQPTRNHPENIQRKEYMCPLCKSLGNIFLPLVWKGKKEEFPGVLASAKDFQFWLENNVSNSINKVEMAIRGLETTTKGEGSGFNRKRSSGGTGRIKGAISNMVPNFLKPNGGALGQDLEESDDFQILELRLHGRSTRNEQFDSASLAFGGSSEPSRQQNDAGGEEDSISAEFVTQMYTRLSDVLRLIYRDMVPALSFLKNTTSVKSADLLWGAVGYSIACVEISQRGIGHSGTTLVDGIPQQTTILLRVLCQSTITYVNAINQLSGYDIRLKQLASIRLRQLFYNNPQLRNQELGMTSMHAQVPYDSASPLMLDDPFLILVELSMYTAPFLGFDIHHLMQLLYVAEIVKTTIAISQRLLGRPESLNATFAHVQVRETLRRLSTNPLSSQESISLRQFVEVVMKQLETTPVAIGQLFRNLNDVMLMKLLQTYCLAFMRKCAILMYSRYGVVFPTTLSDNRSEFERLRTQLRLPSFQEVFAQSFPSSNNQKPFSLASVINGWCRHYKEDSKRTTPSSSDMTTRNRNETQQLITLPHPAIFELVGLPQQLDLLVEESLWRACSKCGNIPPDPALCLFCGTFLCSQNFCCSDRNLGECNLHSAKCGGEVGVFLLVQKCVILLLYHRNGCFKNAPYLDAHGEVDLGLRRGLPQFLNLKRYDEIRKLWLTHSIPVYVARKIESRYDMGGWETL